MKFCKKCYDRMALKWARKAKFDPRYKLDVSKMVFPCQVPIYEPDPSSGEPMVRIWDCKKESFAIYHLKEYNLKKSRGEL